LNILLIQFFKDYKFYLLINVSENNIFSNFNNNNLLTLYLFDKEFCFLKTFGNFSGGEEYTLLNDKYHKNNERFESC